jgi:hypothetical protein
MRLLDRIEPKVVAAIGKLPILAAEKDTYDHEVALAERGGRILALVVICMPIKGTANDVVVPGGWIDPYSLQTEVDQLVSSLYLAGVQQRATLEAQMGGEKTTAGGLAIGKA